MSDSISSKEQHYCPVKDENYVMKVFTCVDHRNENYERKLCIVLVKQGHNTQELSEIDKKDLCEVFSKPFVWKHPKGAKVIAKLATGEFTKQKELLVSRITQFHYPEKFKFKLPKSNATVVFVNVEIFNETGTLCEQEDVKLCLFHTKESKPAKENP